jgi:peptidoglycan/LPS O-acetylase OafA/YrhL
MVRDLAVRTPESRERSVDVWRALAICLVVLGHWFVIAVVYRDGELFGYNALAVLTWIEPVTWLFQVMPIFFLVGGYASGASLASHRALESTASAGCCGGPTDCCGRQRRCSWCCPW